MRKPVIGVIPLYDEFKDSFWMLPGYIRVLEECGALPIIMPLTTDTDELNQLNEMCDGLLLTGGHDVSPSVYGEQPIPECGEPCRQRDEMETYVLQSFLEKDKPVFGICRGIQFMNAFMGGTLYQDLPTEKPSSVEHHMTAPYNRVVHKVKVYDSTPLAEICGVGEMGVNSYHHQAIKNLAPGLESMAMSEDGLIEAVYAPDKTFAMAVQWHPEFSYESDKKALTLMQAFVDACKTQ